MTEYNYTITEDITAQLLNSSTLHCEICSSELEGLVGINVSGDNFTVIFESELSVADKETLDTLISDHEGDELPCTDMECENCSNYSAIN